MRGRQSHRALARRAEIDAHYRRRLAGIRGLHCLPKASRETGNHAYFPVMIDEDFPIGRDALYQVMRGQDILVRRYFHPLISEFLMYRGLPSAAPGNLPVAHAAARRVLCLPIHPELPAAEVDRVCDLIVSQLRAHAA